MRYLILAVLLPLATATHAEEPPRYNAQATIQRAQVGSYSPRLAPPVRVAPDSKAKADPGRYDRKLVCRIDPSRPLGRDLICEKQK